MAFFLRSAIALLLCLGAHQAALAEAGRSLFLEELTWTDVRDDLGAGKTTVIVPVGGTEQSGPHIVLGKHNVRVRALAGRIAGELGNALVAPTLAYVPEGRIDPPAGHMRYAGTISLPEAAFETTLEYAARSFRQHGFRHIVLIGDHGGYQASLARVATRLNREWAASPARVHAVLDYYDAADRGYAALLATQGYREAEVGRHAGLADTSLALAVDERLVRRDRLGVAAAAGLHDGTDGDPRRATAALGQGGLDLVVARARAAIEKEIARR